MAQTAESLHPLYELLKKILVQPKVIGTDDTSMKVLDRKFPFARSGRILPYYDDKDHRVIVSDYKGDARAGLDKFLPKISQVLASRRPWQIRRFLQRPSAGPDGGRLLGTADVFTKLRSPISHA